MAKSTMQSLLDYAQIPEMNAFLADPGLRIALMLITGIIVALFVYRYLVLGLLQIVAVDVAKGTLRAVLKDDELMHLAAKRWEQMMVGLNQNPDFQRTTPDAIMSEMIQDRMRGMFTRLIREEDFVKNSVIAMTDVIHHDTLQEALKEQLKQTFADDALHKAIIKGSMEALKPDWVKALEGQNDGSGNRTPPTSTTPESRRSCG